MPERKYNVDDKLKQRATTWRHLCSCSFSKLLEQKEQLEQKHLHLLQILDTERQSKWQYVQQTEELATEVRKLKSEVGYCAIECLSVSSDNRYHNKSVATFIHAFVTTRVDYCAVYWLQTHPRTTRDKFNMSWTLPPVSLTTRGSSIVVWRICTTLWCP